MKTAVMPMSRTVVRVICRTSDSTNGSIVGRVYHRGPAAPAVPAGPGWPPSGGRSAPRGPCCVDPGLPGGILVEAHEPVEEAQLLARQGAPAVLVVQLHEREVQSHVVGGQRQPLVAGVDRRVLGPVEAVGGGEVQQPSDG